MQAHPDLDTANIVNRILATADPVGKVGNVKYGWGIVDAYKAVTADVPPVTDNPLGTLAEWIPLHRFEEWETTDLPLTAPDEIAVSEPIVPDDERARAAHERLWVGFGVPGLVLGGALASLAAIGFGVFRRARSAHRDVPTG